MISGNAKLAGVIGWPVGHSLSPLLHGHWLAEHGIDGAYVPLAVARENFWEALAGLRLSGFRGVNVTVPHKVAAFALAHTHDDEAQATGAANLLLFEDDGRVAARNTDGTGLLESLKDSLGKDALHGKPAVVLGAGGGARAAVRALDALGASEIRVLNRNGARAEALVAGLKIRTKATLSSASLQDWPTAAKGSAIVVNATSGGMKGSSALALSLDRVDKNMAVCELVYNPRETQLLKDAQARGLRTIDGLGMLMHQAVPSFEAFFGRRPSVTPGLRRVLEKALDNG
jgi:shikimate dehydrogenase